MFRNENGKSVDEVVKKGYTKPVLPPTKVVEQEGIAQNENTLL
jgi:hypothetical protein